jgi:hypothetical protein
MALSQRSAEGPPPLYLTFPFFLLASRGSMMPERNLRKRFK